MKRVAAGDRQRKHPQRHHGREIERADAGAHAERLAHGGAIDAGADVAAELALQQVRNAAGELDDLQAALHGAVGVGQRLAVLGGDDPRELGAVLLERAP